MRNYDLESAFAIRRASVTESSTISFECPHLNPDWLASSSLCFDRGSLTYAINLIKSSGLQSAECDSFASVRDFRAQSARITG